MAEKSDASKTPANEFTDPLSPFYVHPTNLSTQQLSSNVFDGTGFGSWRRSMLIGLSVKNKIGFVDGTLPKPTSGATKIRQWERCNDMVISWILHSVSSEIANGLLYTETAKSIWDELKERFEQYNGAQLYQVQDQLNQASQGSDSSSAYFTKLKGIWEELRSIKPIPSCTCGAHATIMKHEEDQKVIKFLMGLNESYKIVRGNILMMKPIPSINGVYSLLIQEEKQREISSQSPLNVEASAMAARV
ncbi:uncharacterized protein LOC141623716 [Silene latifolia]|uniref:uncharacterized protein LOC141623716 n=1 Tax=Silene latifolia TaxID=37657 RepID=UPI003D770F05